ncbi:MAG: hypothetical protein R2844_14050 [Caldilineales bacterium]
MLRYWVARSRPASNAASVAEDAVSWMTPPPVDVDLNACGSPSMSTSQSRTCVSSSVQAGLVAHSMPCTPSPDDSMSASMAGKEALAGKKAKKLGDCQWVMPGMISGSMSASIAANGSPCSGAWAGRPARISPGCTCDNTGYDPMRS